MKSGEKTLKAMSWNINTGHDYYGDFSQPVDKQHIVRTLDRIVETIVSENPDVALLQEVDYDWVGTQHIDQLECLATKAGFAYHAKGKHHCSIVPERLREYLGDWNNVVWNRDTGTGILSRYPVKEASAFTFGQDFSDCRPVSKFAQLLNESKGYTKAILDVDGADVTVFSVHLLNDIMYRITNHIKVPVRNITFMRKFHFAKLIEHIRKTSGQLIIGGDFNTIPPESDRHNFDDEDNADRRYGDPDDYRGDCGMHIIRHERTLKTIPALAGQGSPDEIRKYWTYPTHNPSRTLDYIFVSTTLEIQDYKVISKNQIKRLQDEGGVQGEYIPSDHLPVAATVTFP